MHFINHTAFQLWLLLLIYVSWVNASEEKTVRPDDSVKPNAEDSVQEDHKYRRLLRAESSSGVGSNSDEKDEKDDKTKKVAKSAGGPILPKAAAKSSDSSSDGSDSEAGNAAVGREDGKSTQGVKREDFEPEGSGERRKKRAAEFYRPILPNAALEE